MDIGLQIKKFREQQKISQEELALKIFVSRQTISNWETNKSWSDSILPIIGMANCSSQSFSTSFEMPVSSAPMTSAVGLRIVTSLHINT